MYRILIVEDDRGIAESIREQANMWGFTAKCAAKFSNIMEEFATFDPQLVLLDISLPFYNGYHLVCGNPQGFKSSGDLHLFGVG